MLDLIHSFFRWLEDISNCHAHTISLLEAVSTTAAIIVALATSYAAVRASRPRLVARVSVVLIIYGDGRPVGTAPSYVSVRLTNIGTVPVRLTSTFFSWRLPFVKSAWLAMPLDETGDGHVNQRRYPIIILPGTSESVFLTSMESFKSSMPRVLDSGRFGRKASRRLLRGMVYADDGSQFRALLDGSFRKELLTLPDARKN